MREALQEILGYENDREAIISRIRILSKEVWENHVFVPDIERWLDNFDGRSMDVNAEHINALHLLSHFNYFGLKEIRELLKSLFRDLYKYPIIQDLRKDNGKTRDSSLLQSLFRDELKSTRFLGMGNPSESGGHLLYYFRQENGLSKSLFINPHEILDKPPGDPTAQIAIPGLKRLVFIDDLLGSGSQAIIYSDRLLKSIKEAAKRSGTQLQIFYFMLFAKPEGLAAVTSHGGFDRVQAVHAFDPSESAFDPNSRVYLKNAKGVSMAQGRQLASFYGEILTPGAGLGYRDGQLLLGLHHNVPDNTLPIFWCDEISTDWTPIFPRYNKVY